MNVSIANAIVLLTCVVATIGWLLSFAGLCASSAWVNPASWWIIIYQLAILLLVCCVLWINSVESYHGLILALIAINVPYATGEVTSYLYFGRTSLTITAVGQIMTIIAQFFWLFFFGVTYDAAFFPSMKDLYRHYNSTYPQTTTHPPLGNHTGTGNNALNLYKEYDYGSSIRPVSPRQEHNSPPMFVSNPPVFNLHDSPMERIASNNNNITNTVIVSPHAEYNIPVVAIHPYEANPEDPNELSFSRGETLHVHKKEGSWWQARKADGTVGMIPSNYVS
ncbi:uncharacterized protein BYT42DRAFT_610151 [Radiomyces spectabilis]|uniref:uncharacterized protein n=1 Tax=Radiomyces spectabilis TaxID=64574 RepID=UPI00221F4B1A|nr:uncharacterized protein BYT42DRAFT_610151 [Radiomyces spectabilis]KAI8390882.1 hypothetical protein BYT42DRAFT_610151 [Radiomyces spectabilis]